MNASYCHSRTFFRTKRLFTLVSVNFGSLCASLWLQKFLILNFLKKGHTRKCNVQLTFLSANPTNWSSTLKQFVPNCLSVFNHFVGLALKGFKFPKEANYIIFFNPFKTYAPILYPRPRIH